MQTKNKVFVLLPDGVGLRNFAFTKFYELGLKQGCDVTFWNNTPFNLDKLGYKEIKIHKAKSHYFTDVLKNARKQIELNLNVKRTKDSVYNSYRFPYNYKTFKTSIKSVITQILILFFSTEKGLVKIKKAINFFEKKTSYFKDSYHKLKKESPSFIFCTNQRPMLAIAPLLAAKELGIPTATFIFSWDNLPKATMVVETDYYFVWSEFMKQELLRFYPYIKENQIYITGTPQFEMHFQPDIIMPKEDFYARYNLNENYKYICFSGDDETTSPNDPIYLKDLAESVSELNKKGYQLGIIFRKCPVDFSGRYDQVLHDFKSIICPINPLWKNVGNTWDSVMPTKEDIYLLISTIAYSELVINIGSSMVFDFISFNKPCYYINYDVSNSNKPEWSTQTIYKFVHFRSMPSKDSVYWVNSKNDYLELIPKNINFKNDNTPTKKWFDIIVGTEPTRASENIWRAIDQILK